MSTQPEALRLADRLESDFIRSQTMVDAAAELRRLHAENRVLHERHHDGNVILTQILAQRDALLEALKAMLEQFNYHTITGIVHDESAAIAKARAAIKKVQGDD